MVQMDGSKPIYIQISEWLENEIISGNFEEDGKVYSQYQLAEQFTINPATAAKGLNLLSEEGILYKKRGLGMFVSKGAKRQILDRRRSETLKVLIEELVSEAARLDVEEEELISLVKEANRRSEGK